MKEISFYHILYFQPPVFQQEMDSWPELAQDKRKSDSLHLF